MGPEKGGVALGAVLASHQRPPMESPWPVALNAGLPWWPVSDSLFSFTLSVWSGCPALGSPLYSLGLPLWRCCFVDVVAF